MGLNHVVVTPYPAQGHVIPLMELSHCLADHGFTITFVNTEFNHNRVLAAMSNKDSKTGQIHLVSIPDGLGPGEDRNNIGKLTEALLRVMPEYVEEIIRKSSGESGKGKITCMIADQTMAWALVIAKKMGLRSAAFWPAAAGVFAKLLRIPKLIEDRIIDTDGLPKRRGMFQLNPSMRTMNIAHMSWNCFPDSETKRIFFRYLVDNIPAIEIAEFTICNSFYELESQVFTFDPKIKPVGPLLTGQLFAKPVGHFWPENMNCTAWLDEQPNNSVIYVAFGSFTVFDKHQFQELALGLELSGRPFLEHL